MEEIYTYEQLDLLITNKIINKSFWVNSTLVNELKGVNKILIEEYGSVYFKNLINLGELEHINCDFSFFGSMKTLGRLKYVGGSFRFGAPIISLGELEEVRGDLRPTTSELLDLGKLKRVGGTADFRGMVHLKNLGNLEKVGGNLNLVKSLKGQYDLSRIKVGGRVIYWNKEPAYYLESNKEPAAKNIPVWENKAIYEFENNLVYPNRNQLDFFNHFKENFQKGIYIDVGGMRNYITYFIYSLLNEYESNKRFDFLSKNYQILREEYPDISQEAERIEVRIGRKLGLKKYIDNVNPYEEYIAWLNLLEAKIRQVNSKIITSNDEGLFEILKIGFKKSNLTEFGLENLEITIEKILYLIRIMEVEENEAFSERFFTRGKYYKITRDDEVFAPEYYERFFESEELFNEQLIEHNHRNKGVPPQNILYPVYYPTILTFAVENYIKELAREAENEVRIERDLPKVGEGWISETNLFYKIKNSFDGEKVIHHGRAKWLGLQHLDIYFPELNIALEYQGRQHTEIVEYFGGESSFLQGIENDRIKNEKCKQNNCILIEVFPDYNYEEVIRKVRSAIEIQKNR